MFNLSTIKTAVLLLTVTIIQTQAFAPSSTHIPLSSFQTALNAASSTNTETLSIKLIKPLGLILEEVNENEANGVKVEEISDMGSAYDSPYKDQLIGLKIVQVMDQDVSSMVFDDVMDCLINAPEFVSLSFEVPTTAVEESGETVVEEVSSFDVGTVVTIQVKQEGNADKAIEAKVGDNLRKTLLENDVELYRGLKKKLGNCGGGGQCTFCAVDFVESEGWEQRSEYEEGKIGKFPTARLACMNNIQGPATIRVQ